MALTVMALIKAQEGKADELKKELQNLVGPTCEEEGCINYDLHQSQEDENLFMFYENWDSKNHLERHLASSHIQHFLEKEKSLLAEPISIQLFERV